MHASMIRRTHAVRGFSLVEMLLAIFILGIGVISIAALFPAGIALQRQATDDVVGPIVAKNALATIRSKLSQGDFGSFQDFGLGPTYNNGIAGSFKTSGNVVFPHVSGDWCWMRPGFLFDQANNGTVDVFSAGYTRFSLSIQPTPPTGNKATEIPDGVAFSANSSLFGIPYNPRKYPLFTDPAAAANLDPVSQRLLEPLVTFTQAERSWPQAGSSASNTPPQYYWDCMFRRNGGRVQVAVFVYRVTPPGGEPRGYAVARSDNATLGTPSPASAMDVTIQTPPIPMVYYAPNPGVATSWPNRSGGTAPPDEVAIPAGTLQPGKTWDDWMSPGQVWIDNHGNTHGVLRGRIVTGTANAYPNIKLQRRIPVMPRAPVYGTAPGVAADNIPAALHAYIEAIWFVPNSDLRGNIITPVYATVEEL